MQESNAKDKRNLKYVSNGKLLELNKSKNWILKITIKDQTLVNVINK